MVGHRWQGALKSAHLLSLLDATTRSQSRTLYFFRNFFVRYLRYLHAGDRFVPQPTSIWNSKAGRPEACVPAAYQCLE